MHITILPEFELIKYVLRTILYLLYFFTSLWMGLLNYKNKAIETRNCLVYKLINYSFHFLQFFYTLKYQNIHKNNNYY